MKTIDEQIQDLKKEKAKLEYQKYQDGLVEIKKLAEGIKSKYYMVFNGANSMGSASWQFMKVINTDISQSQGHNINDVSIRAYCDVVYVKCNPALLVGRTYYGKSAGNNKHKTSTESPYSNQFSVFMKLRKNGRLKKVDESINFDTAEIYNVPMSSYISNIEWKAPLMNTKFPYSGEEITEAEYMKYVDMAEEINMYIWSRMEGTYNKWFRKVWSSGTVLAVNPSESRTIKKHVAYLNAALDSTGKKYEGNIMDKFLEFLEKQKDIQIR